MQTLDHMTEEQQLDELKREWLASPALKREFADSFARYAAFKKAEMAGLAKILKGSTVKAG